MSQKRIAAVLADMTPAREEKLRSRTAELGYELLVMPKGNYDVKKLPGCEILFGSYAPKDLHYATDMKWLHTASAGVDVFTDDSLYPNPDVVLTNSSGAYGVAISEHLLTVTLMLLRRMPEYMRGQQRKEWIYLGKIRSVYNSVVTVIGIGDIGGNFAKRCKAIGATVRGVKRTPANKPDYIDELYLSEDLDRAIEGADVVALCLPGTDNTKKIMTAQRLAKMKNGAVLLNIGRGTAVDQQALYEELKSGRLGGAALDVADPEPLPPEHPLWDLENLILTPHVSGNDSLDHTTDTIIDLFLENLRLYSEGKPMHHVIDRKVGY